jgi:hypothetical protein
MLTNGSAEACSSAGADMAELSSGTASAAEEAVGS